MDVHNRCSPRRLILCLAVPTGLALMAMLAPSLVAAQGTPQQRAACEDGKRGKSRGCQAVAHRCLTIAGKYGTSG